jgi:hypothetical protein
MPNYNSTSESFRQTKRAQRPNSASCPVTKFPTLAYITGTYVGHFHQRLRYVIRHITLSNNRVQKPLPQTMDESALNAVLGEFHCRGQKQLILAYPIRATLV